MQNFISIPKPCNENWNAMTPEEQGRHCDKCNIVVKDFSAMSNEEILDYLKYNKTPHCVRTRNDQLNIPLEFTDKLKQFLYLLVFIFLPFALFQKDASANENFKTAVQKKSSGLDGKVYNSKGEPLPFVMIQVFEGGTPKGACKSDLKGNFKIRSLAPGTYTLEASFVGYNKLEIMNIVIEEETIQTKNITMNESKNKIIHIHIVGGLKRSLINPEKPNKQEISGEEIRSLLGGH